MTSDKARRRIWFYHDGRHPHIYRYEPPMRREEYVACIDELAGTPVETVSFCLGEGRTVLHDTQVGELLGDNVDKWDHLIFRRAHQNARGLIDAGHDPLRLVCDRARLRGIGLYPCLLVQNPGVESATVRCSDFRRHNPHLEIRARGDVDTDLPWIDGLDFAHEEVRQERFALIEETLSEYDVDGFELQLNIQPRFFHPDEIAAGRQLMTDWVGRVCEAVRRTGADRELAVRVPLDVEIAHGIGLDVAEWVRQGIVDVVIPERFAGPHRVDPNLDFRPLLALTKGTSCRVIPALHSGVGSDRVGEGPIAMIRAQACNFWDQGVDGLYLAQWFHHWPYGAGFYERLRELPFPDIMAARDKYYYVPTDSSFGAPPGAQPLLPVELAEGTPAQVRFVISDDLPGCHEAGRVHEVLLRIGLAQNTELDRVAFRLNGRQLPLHECRRINQMYRMHAPRHRGGPTYWYIFRLATDKWPRPGDNTLEVTLLERDAAVLGTVALRDVELEIKYLMGRSSPRGFVDADLGLYEHAVS
ncbi:MAG: hypothetical protein VCF24_20885 [Candidatus Latescibacterota bacterium]